MNKYYKVTFEMDGAWAVDISTVVSAKTKSEAIAINLFGKFLHEFVSKFTGKFAGEFTVYFIGIIGSSF